jgi:acetyl-CoA carboxylase biotin carboxyl carrier protein
VTDELSKGGEPFDVEAGNALPFDVRAVGDLVKLMKEFDVSEIDLQEGDKRIRLRRGQRVIAAAAPPMVMPQPTIAPAPVTSGSTPGTTSPPAGPSRGLIEIKSELVGTFYAKPAPDKDDYVKVGSRVSPDSVVCKVEAMKIFNDITAKCNGTIEEICVQNGSFVEFEQVLFRVNPS